MYRSCLVLALLVCFASAAAPVTEADIKAMKIKQLKQFLEDRAVDCAGCQEKGDFQKMAIKHLNTPLSDAAKSRQAAKVEIPPGKLWEVWGTVAKTACSDAHGSDDVCNSVYVAVESSFMMHGKRTAQKLKKKPDDILKTSFLEPYHSAGKRIVKKAVKFAVNTKATSASSIQEEFEKKFVPWMTNVGIENTNPMYEALKEKDEL